MAAISWRLCLVIALSVVVSRPSTTMRTGSPDSGWWGTKEAKQLQGSARKEIVAGNYAAAEKIFAEAALRAKARGDRIATARLLSGIGGTRMARFDYQAALNAYLEAKQVAENAGDWLDLGAVDLNLSNLYEQVWDLSAALRAAEEGQAATSKGRAYYKAELLLQLGRLHAERRDQNPMPFLSGAIEAARTEEQVSVEALGWSLLGTQRLSLGDIDDAEEALLRAYYLRHLFMRRDEGLSYLDLGAARLAEAEAAPLGSDRTSLLGEAERLTGRVPAEDNRIVSFQLRQQRGRILLLRGDVPEALAEFSAAVDLAEQWRGGMATAELQEQVLSEFIKEAADYGIKTGNPKWIEASFLAEEGTRSSNLRDSPAMVEAWRRRLPGRFWSTLAELRAAQSRLRRGGLDRSAESDRLQLELISMEAEAGLGVNLEKNSESFREQPSLIHYQSVLSNSAVLLSFELGETRSFLWAVTRNSLSVYRLPPREQIGKLVRDFRETLEAGRPEAHWLGKELYSVLFGQLKPQEAGKRDWLVSAAHELLQLPFAALVPATSAGANPPYLAVLHSVQIVSGPLVPAGRVIPAREDRFLAVGDPIYNTADPRWKGSRSFSAATYKTQLNRLAGSGREVDLSSGRWTNAVVLKGPAASKERFLKELERQPRVIHLATHVLSGASHANESFFAFSVRNDGEPELMGTADVAMLRVPGALVVMTGCETAGGDMQTGSGLANLTRAWTLAGASAVVATHWPMQDSGYDFLDQFYNHLHEDGPAEALAKVQAALIRAGGPASVWASFEVYGGQVYGDVQ